MFSLQWRNVNALTYYTHHHPKTLKISTAYFIL